MYNQLKQYYYFPKGAENLVNHVIPIINNLIRKKINDEINLSSLHKVISKSDINDFRLSAFREINNSLNWKELIKKEIGPILNPILGQDILIQTKLNLSIQMPEDDSSILSLHSDCNSGDSPFQLNLWIPITSSYKTNSMFILDEEKTFDYLDILLEKKEIVSNLKPKDDDFITAEQGDLIIFNPFLMHGNELNQTSDTRISLNLRVKSLFSPDGNSADRKTGTYYEVLSISDFTKTALKYLKVIENG